MTEEDLQPRSHGRKMLWTALALLVVVLAGLLVPPYISISRYKKSITELMSRSLGRPVRLSSVELRLLPWPGFVLTDLTVEEDPAYGAEPVLHANTVKASIRLLSLWRGRLEIDSVAVDEASLNLVRVANGEWNLDPLFRTAAAHVRPGGGNPTDVHSVRLPYLEATNSRINFKNGDEKLPFSLVDADISFWQENPGEWRLRLRGQPARTDVTLDLADTGLVRMEADLHNAPELRQMPIRVDLQWKEAQLGQLSRLLIGSDPGWRGDLTGQLHLEGTPNAAHVTTRLSASGVHRVEFAPAEPLDFDANCGFLYHYSSRTVENLDCDSPLGDGHVHLEGGFPGDAPPRLTLSLDQISTQAGLDVLRTLRRGIPDDLNAQGRITGKLNYDPAAATQVDKPANLSKKKAKKAEPQILPFNGSLQVTGLALSGGPLDQPLKFPNFKLQPVSGETPQPAALIGEAAVAAGGPSPLSVSARITHSRYELALAGPASFKRLEQFAQLTGLSNAVHFDQFSGDAPVLDFQAQGTWIPPEVNVLTTVPIRAIGATIPDTRPSTAADLSTPISGTMSIHKAMWRPEDLANPVTIEEASFQVDANGSDWDGNFSYGSVKGSGSVQVPLSCDGSSPCAPDLTLTFDKLDAEVVLNALLGAGDKKTLLSSLIAKFTSTAPPPWPRANVTVNAGMLTLGPVQLEDARLELAIHPDSAEIKEMSASLFGGTIELNGTATNSQQPVYSLTGSLEKADPKEFCRYLEFRCGGGPIGVTGKVDLAGFTAKSLAASAKGSLHLDWTRGAVQARMAAPGAAVSASPLPSVLARFTHWAGDASISNATVQMEKSNVARGRKISPVPVSITLGEPPAVSFPAEKAVAKK